MPEPSSRKISFRFWIACFIGALIVRGINFAPVFLGDSVRLIGTDPYYHVRRIYQAVLHFPHLPSFDPYLGYPFGATCPYEPGLDLMLATVCRLLLGATPNEQQVMAVCAGVMPLLGLAVITIYIRLGLSIGGPTTSKFTAIWLVLLPGVFFPSQLGQVDHHVLEPIISGLVLLAGIHLLQRPECRRTPIVVGLLLGGSLLFWRGMILPAGLVAAALGLRTAWHCAMRTSDHLAENGGATVFFVAALIALPIGLASPTQERLSYFTISLLQPVTLALLAAASLLIGTVARRRARPGTTEQLISWRQLIGQILACLILGLLPFALVGVLVPDLLANLFRGLGFLSRADVFVQAVSEQRPLFTNDDGQPSLLYPLYFYTAFFPLFPLVVYAAFRSRVGIHRESSVVDTLGPASSRFFQQDTVAARQSEADAGPSARPSGWDQPDHPWWIFVLWSGTMLAMALGQRRYAVLFAPLYAVWMGFGADALLRFVKARGSLLRAVVTASTTLLFIPTAVLIGAQFRTPVQDPALIDAMSWLEANTPETAGYALVPTETGFEPPEYGVVAAWEEGHHLVALAHRPNVANPFGIEWFKPGLERVARFWLAKNDEIAGAMDATGARYAVTSFRMGLLRDEARFLGLDPDAYAIWSDEGWSPGPRFGAAAAARLYVQDGLAAGDRPPVPGVRLVWEGGSLDPFGPAARVVGEDAPAYKIFERVKGTRITGAAPPESTVHARQPVVSPSGRRFEYQLKTRAGSDGRWVILAPYASEGMPAGWVKAVGPLVIDTSTGPYRLRISDWQVRDGAVLEVGEDGGRSD